MHTGQQQIGVVIGGGNGIGEACSHLMVERGWKVAVADFDGEAARRVAEEIGAHGYQVDVRDRAALVELAKTVERDVGPVDSLIVPAAVVQNRYKPEEFPMEEYRNILVVNIEGTFNCCTAFAAGMLERKKGSIVNVGSSTNYCGQPLHAYGPSKAAVVNLTRSLAGQWGRSGIRVNSVSPGLTLVKRVLARPPGRYAGNVNDHFALGRRVEPSEVAEAIEFLASDRAAAITGIDLLVDAGLLAANGWGLYGGVPGTPGSLA